MTKWQTLFLIDDDDDIVFVVVVLPNSHHTHKNKDFLIAANPFVAAHVPNRLFHSFFAHAKQKYDLKFKCRRFLNFVRKRVEKNVAIPHRIDKYAHSFIVIHILLRNKCAT